MLIIQAATTALDPVLVVQGAAPHSSVKQVRTAPCRAPCSSLAAVSVVPATRARQAMTGRFLCAGAKGSVGVCSAFNASEVATYTYRTRGADWPDIRAWQCGPSSCPRGAPRAAAARVAHAARLCRCNGTRQSPVEYPLPAGAPARFVTRPAQASGAFPSFPLTWAPRRRPVHQRAHVPERAARQPVGRRGGHAVALPAARRARTQRRAALR